jgi:hypothetical protein
MQDKREGYWFLIAGTTPGVVVDTHQGTIAQVQQKARVLARKHASAIWAIRGEPTGVLAWPRVQDEPEPVYIVEEDDETRLLQYLQIAG